MDEQDLCLIDSNSLLYYEKLGLVKIAVFQAEPSQVISGLVRTLLMAFSTEYDMIFLSSLPERNIESLITRL